MKKLLLLLLLSLSSAGFAACNAFWAELVYPEHLLVEDAYGECHIVINPNANTSNSYSGNCACPYDTASDGSRCGARSAWSRSGGASPKCDVSYIQNAVDLADTPGAGMMYNAQGIGRREGEAYEAAGEGIVTLLESFFNAFDSSKSIPPNAFKSPSGWVCKAGYFRHNNGCRKSSKNIPRNATKVVDGWVCNYGYRKVGKSMCVRK